MPLMADQEQTYGWVTADNLLITEFHAGTVMRGEWAAFALRVDSRRVNTRLLRAQIDLEVRGRLKGMQDAGDKPRIGRDERKELREDLRKELLRQTSPKVDAYTVLVHPKNKDVHVLTLGTKANELVRLHFADTFEADLQPLTPWTRSLELLETEARTGNDLRAGLQDLRRSDFGRRLPEADTERRSAIATSGVEVRS